MSLPDNGSRDRGIEFANIGASAGIHADTNNIPALPLEPRGGSGCRRVLDGRRHDTAARGARSRTANGKIVRFSAAGREYDLVRVTTNECSNFGPRALDCIVRPPTVEVSTRRVSEVLV